mgnify:FL=1
MTRRPLAPALRLAVWYDRPGPVNGPEDLRPAWRELRALLVVARAARRVSGDTAGDPLAVEHLCALDRAVERLERVSGRKP